MNPHALATLLEHEESLRDQARLAWRSAADAAAAADTQAAQLLAYRQEYQQHWNAQFRQQGGIELLRSYQGFMQRLDEAIAQQQQVQQRSGEHSAAAAQALAAAEQRVAAVQKLQQRRAQAQAQAQSRREQRGADELAQRQHAHGPHALRGPAC